MADNSQKRNDDMSETFVPTKPGAADKKSVADAGKKDDGKSGEKKKEVVLGDFKLLKKLGQGGMGEVFLGEDLKLGRQVAIKVLSREMAKKPGFVERFVREARAMAKIDHTNAVKVYAADEDKGLNYVAIEFIDGQSMQDWMDDKGKLSVGDAIHVVMCCADALAHAHEMNLIHRDIKPDNILVTKKGVVKVADFGLAKALDEGEMSMTQSGTGLGTPLYMPPEQARDAKIVDHRTDIYALGITFYYFLTGKLPFEGDSVIKLIMAKEKGQYPNARKVNPEVSEKLDMIVDKMIQKDVKHRYASCGDLMADLDKLGLESQSLSFCDAGDAGGVRSNRARSRVGTSSVGTSNVGGATSPAVSLPQFRTSAEDATQSHQAAVSKDMTPWFVRYTNAKGDTTVKEMTTRQIQQGIMSDVLDVKSQAQKKTSTSGFLPLASYSEFSELMKKKLVKTNEGVRNDSLKDQFKKLDKEVTSRKRWHRVKQWFEGAVGGVGFILYMGGVCVALFAAYWIIRHILYPPIVDYFNSLGTS